MLGLLPKEEVQILEQRKSELSQKRTTIDVLVI